MRDEKRATAALAFWGLHWERLLMISSFALKYELRRARQSQHDSTTGAQKLVGSRFVRAHMIRGTNSFEWHTKCMLVQ